MSKKGKYLPYHPVEYEDHHASAFQALSIGEATKEQQIAAVKYLINDVCRTYDLPYHESERDSCFAQGKRFVGLQVVKLINLNLGKLKKEKLNNGKPTS